MVFKVIFRVNVLIPLNMPCAIDTMKWLAWIMTIVVSITTYTIIGDKNTSNAIDIIWFSESHSAISSNSLLINHSTHCSIYVFRDLGLKICPIIKLDVFCKKVGSGSGFHSLKGKEATQSLKI